MALGSWVRNEVSNQLTTAYSQMPIAFYCLLLLLLLLFVRRPKKLDMWMFVLIRGT